MVLRQFGYDEKRRTMDVFNSFRSVVVQRSWSDASGGLQKIRKRAEREQQQHQLQQMRIQYLFA